MRVIPLYSHVLDWVHCSGCGREYTRGGEPACTCKTEEEAQSPELRLAMLEAENQRLRQALALCADPVEIECAFLEKRVDEFCTRAREALDQ